MKCSVRRLRALVAVAAFAFVASGCSLQQSQATKAAVNEAEGHVATAMSLAVNAQDVIFEGNPPQPATSDARLKMEKAVSELAASRAAVGVLSESAGRKSYLEALDIYDAVVFTLEVGIDLAEAWAAEQEGASQLVEAAAATKVRDYALASTKAQAAYDSFARSRALFAEHLNEEGLELQGFVDGVELGRLSAAKLVKATKYVKARDENAYVAAIDEQNSLARRFIAHPNTRSVGNLLGDVLYRANQGEADADAVRKHALERLGVRVPNEWVHGQLYRRAKEKAGIGP